MTKLTTNNEINKAVDYLAEVRAERISSQRRATEAADIAEANRRRAVAEADSQAKLQAEADAAEALELETQYDDTYVKMNASCAEIERALIMLTSSLSDISIYAAGLDVLANKLKQPKLKYDVTHVNLLLAERLSHVLSETSFKAYVSPTNRGREPLNAHTLHS